MCFICEELLHQVTFFAALNQYFSWTFSARINDWRLLTCSMVSCDANKLQSQTWSRTSLRELWGVVPIRSQVHLPLLHFTKLHPPGDFNPVKEISSQCQTIRIQPSVKLLLWNVWWRQELEPPGLGSLLWPEPGLGADPLQRVFNGRIMEPWWSQLEAHYPPSFPSSDAEEEEEKDVRTWRGGNQGGRRHLVVRNTNCTWIQCLQMNPNWIHMKYASIFQ